jgi:hypothetical protein
MSFPKDPTNRNGVPISKDTNHPLFHIRYEGYREHLNSLQPTSFEKLSKRINACAKNLGANFQATFDSMPDDARAFDIMDQNSLLGVKNLKKMRKEYRKNRNLLSVDKNVYGPWPKSEYKSTECDCLNCKVNRSVVGQNRKELSHRLELMDENFNKDICLHRHPVTCSKGCGKSKYSTYGFEDIFKGIDNWGSSSSSE